ncbi:hypothetical protein MLD52_22980 [Puniceicoccaceae bacterium K14]|nr:hypothetical protein [Puniceicoccaceae bacterium K14]
MKIFAIALILVGAWFGLVTLGIIVDGSQHMGSSLRSSHSKEFIHYSIDEAKIENEEARIIKNQVDEMIDLGRNGYELLIETTEMQMVSSALMVIAGIILLKIKNKSNNKGFFEQ